MGAQDPIRLQVGLNISKEARRPRKLRSLGFLGFLGFFRFEKDLTKPAAGVKVVF